VARPKGEAPAPSNCLKPANLSSKSPQTVSTDQVRTEKIFSAKAWDAVYYRTAALGLPIYPRS
jgi:hypothetical protein